MTVVMSVVVPETRFFGVWPVRQCGSTDNRRRRRTKIARRGTDERYTTASGRACLSTWLTPVYPQYGVTDDDITPQRPPYWGHSRHWRWPA